jgi:hypothetical protein
MPEWLRPLGIGRYGLWADPCDRTATATGPALARSATATAGPALGYGDPFSATYARRADRRDPRASYSSSRGRWSRSHELRARLRVKPANRKVYLDGTMIGSLIISTA